MSLPLSTLVLTINLCTTFHLVRTLQLYNNTDLPIQTLKVDGAAAPNHGVPMFGCTLTAQKHNCGFSLLPAPRVLAQQKSYASHLEPIAEHLRLSTKPIFQGKNHS